MIFLPKVVAALFRLGPITLACRTARNPTLIAVLALAGLALPAHAQKCADYPHQCFGINWQEPLTAAILSGVDVNARNEYDRTPLHHLLFFSPQNKPAPEDIQLTELVEALIAAGADVNARDLSDREPLFFADDAAVAKILLTAGSDVNARDFYGETPLYSHSYNLALISLYLQAGADLNVISDTGHTPLHAAAGVDEATAESLAVVEALLDAGADVNALNYYGHTPIWEAFIAGNEKIMAALIKAGANLNKYYDLYTILHWAAQFGKASSISLLLEAGADHRAISPTGTPFYVALKADNYGSALILLWHSFNS